MAHTAANTQWTRADMASARLLINAINAPTHVYRVIAEAFARHRLAAEAAASDLTLEARLQTAEAALAKIADYPKSKVITSNEHGDRETLINIARIALGRY